ncbi:tryptophan halogenase family protein [Ferrimonas marina]|uniref:Tryptophan halogenase n=1 Tax=Ferrimonas marina TaxID=299255 RepID=A0A1M5YWP5_9GAMM|nr:tryptophan halogenase family protein [Ferrimonas marina]SHI16260.1 Tryptophan halogenase [Ferrimonas marina]
MQNPIQRVVIVGGGAAGWLTAGVLAAKHNADQGRLAPTPPLSITLIESPDVPTVGVGEGTWPSMRSTLETIGIRETEFLRCCDASFKQGSRFRHWGLDDARRLQEGVSDQYLHPFTLPQGQNQLNLADFWLPFREQVTFSEAVCAQEAISQAGLAPKTLTTPEYHFHLNYGYHLDAAKFGQLLQRHCTEKLGVTHLQDHVVEVVSHPSGDIAQVITQGKGAVEGDLFIDCSGRQSMLLGQHLKVPYISQKSVLFNDRAMALQVPYQRADDPIASCTLSTATEHGWIWDIGLPKRRGVGVVFSADHCSEAQAEQHLAHYLGGSIPKGLTPRIIQYRPGHHQVCWQNNCVAVGMAAGFIEPLEASALALIEWTANALADQFPRDRAAMPLLAQRMNRRYRQHWHQIIEFLKLHYVLSRREQGAYWRDHRDPSTCPDSLLEQLDLWQYQPPGDQDVAIKQPLFPAASYQYVLYGMGFETQAMALMKPSDKALARRLFDENQQQVAKLQRLLPSNRALLDQVSQYGFNKI